ncbi:MAG: AI-2E family transporter [Ardenticatenales bacterium]|nr:AI-2E family transporter [Ardenticatenales bacterium]
MSELPSPSTTQRPRWGTATKLVVAVLLLLGAVALFQRIQIIIPPVILAAILAFVLNPVVSFFHRRARIPRSLVLVLIYLALMALLSIVVATIAPPLIGQIQNLMVKVPAILRDIESGLEGRAALGPLSVDLSGLLDETEELLLNTVQSLGSESINFLGGVLTSVAELGVTAVFTFIISFYLVKDGHQALDWAYRIAPPALVSDLRRLVGEISLIWGGFFRGQIVLGMVGGLIVGTGSAIIGLPMPLLMGVLAGLLELLPSLGHGIWLALAVPLALFSGSTWEWMPLSHFWFAVLLVALHIVFQQVDLNYIIPRIIGRRVHLHPLIVIMGILVGAALGGVLGVFLAAPTIASLRVLGRYVYANLLDMDPFPSGLADEEEE